MTNKPLSPVVLEATLIAGFVASLRSIGKISNSSILAYQCDLIALESWLSENNSDLLSIDNRAINQYLLFRMSAGYKASSNARLLSSIKKFYRYLVGLQLMTSDPSFAIVPPKVLSKPVKVLSELQLETLMAVPNIDQFIGLRDRAMLEVLCSTGVKVSELIELRLSDVNFGTAMIKVKTANNSIRSVYLTPQCCRWLKKYQSSARQAFIIKQDSDLLFLSQRGLKMTRQTFWYRIKGYAVSAKLDFVVSAQALRRSFAVHLLREGIELPVVQQVLGHSKIASTNKYTNV
ncbi:MAG: tyrosine-type recombinase/integrase [Oceanospirillaceae bacterium]|nr:tyrosine-type recombinase/integrase [Oceanospirillaceae bacterium]